MKLLKKYGIEIFVFLATTIIFIIQGYNVWAEIVFEYLPYATSDFKMSSLAGYITLFPYIVAKTYFYLPIHCFISWALFSAIVSYLFVLLCMYALVAVMKKYDKKIQLLFFIPVFSMLAHPSVSCLINITHMGYLPVIAYIICNIFEKDFEVKIIEIPYICFIPLVISIISKPSLSFLPLFFVLIFTKLYKNKPKFIIILISVALSAYQTILFGGAGSRFLVKGILDIFKFALVFIQNVGSIFIFPAIYYIDEWNDKKALLLIVLSIIIGILILLLVAYYIFKNNKINKKYNLFRIITRIMIAYSFLLICVFPYCAVDCTSKLFYVLKDGIISSFSKIKLQYQLISTIIGLSFFVYLINNIKIKKIKKYITIIIIVVYCNGLLAALYAGRQIGSNIITTDEFKYNQEMPFLNPPYAEWNYALYLSTNGWPNGIDIYKFYNKPVSLGNVFNNINSRFVESIPKQYNSALIYLVYSDNTIKLNSETCWPDYLFKNNKRKKLNLTIDDKNYLIEFSKSSIYSTRYAILEYSYDLAYKIYNNEFEIYDNNKKVNNDNINIIVAWK